MVVAGCSAPVGRMPERTRSAYIMVQYSQNAFNDEGRKAHEGRHDGPRMPVNRSTNGMGNPHGSIREYFRPFGREQADQDAPTVQKEAGAED